MPDGPAWTPPSSFRCCTCSYSGHSCLAAIRFLALLRVLLFGSHTRRQQQHGDGKHEGAGERPADASTIDRPTYSHRSVGPYHSPPSHTLGRPQQPPPAPSRSRRRPPCPTAESLTAMRRPERIANSRHNWRQYNYQATHANAPVRSHAACGPRKRIRLEHSGTALFQW